MIRAAALSLAVLTAAAPAEGAVRAAAVSARLVPAIPGRRAGSAPPVAPRLSLTTRTLGPVSLSPALSAPLGQAAAPLAKPAFAAAETLPETAPADFRPFAPIAESAVGRALRDSSSLAAAAKKLETLGVLRRGEFDPGADSARLGDKLRVLWDNAAGRTGEPEGIAQDGRWPVPALRVRRGETDYFVHGLVHGMGFPAGAGAVRALARMLEARGAPLYSEQRFPGAYGYRYGVELLHLGRTGGEAAGLAAAPSDAAAKLGAALRGALTHAAAAAAAFSPALLLASDPGRLWAWGLLAATASVYALARLSFFPFFRLYFRALASSAEASGRTDAAAHLRAYAAAAFRRPFDWARFRSVQLPMPLLAAADPEGAARARSLAGGVLAGTEEGAAREIHILTGAENMRGVAWEILTRGTGPR